MPDNKIVLIKSILCLVINRLIKKRLDLKLSNRIKLYDKTVDDTKNKT